MKRRQPDHTTPYSVIQANRKLYDCAADRYEEIDGRRSPELHAWLEQNLSRIRRRAPGERLLDLGCGSGLVTRCANGLFALRIGIDLSTHMMARNRAAFDSAVVGDINCLPFANRSFDVVTCFAVLHHLFSFESLVSEIGRILRPGGIFYSDHDMDAAFNKRFRLPLWLYRKARNSHAKYGKVSTEITPEVYHLAEWHEDGVDSSLLTSLLHKAGFNVETHFHWFGLAGITNRLFGERRFGSGQAPLLSILAVKKR
jgi:SAM-dependent methyltransferase